MCAEMRSVERNVSYVGLKIAINIAVDTNSDIAQSFISHRMYAIAAHESQGALTKDMYTVQSMPRQQWIEDAQNRDSIHMFRVKNYRR